MRIAQVSLLGYYNYGQALQRFALQHTLKKFSESVEVLWISGNRCFAEAGGKPIVQCVKFEEQHDWEKKFFPREAARQAKFKDFENLHIRTRFDFPYFEDIADEYDFFIVGSDQVWNPNYGKIFLPFVPREKKIAYAASIGTPEIPDDKKEIFRRGISDFNHLSVREEDAVKIIKELTGRASIVVPDPVLLLSKEEWLTVSQRPTWFKEKYRNGFVLTYYLRRLPPPEVKTLADELGLPVINLLDAENYNHFTVGPAEFVWLFANASLIFTNSFHGVALSILFKRPFINREIENDQSGVSMSNRMMTVLELFGLMDRRPPAEKFFTAKEALAIDFTRRDEVLPVERAKAFNFLAGALSGAPTKK